MAIIQCKQLHHPAIRALLQHTAHNIIIGLAKVPIIPARADICLSDAVPQESAH